MQLIGRTLAASALWLAAGSAAAIPIHVGSWSVTDAKEGSHGIWLNTKIYVGGQGDRTFNIESGSFSVLDEGGGNFSANLSGRAFSSDLGGGFDFDVDFTYLCTGVTACDAMLSPFENPQPNGTVGSQNQEVWDFYAMDDSLLEGFGSLDGFDLGISQRPSDGRKPFRWGEGADWFNSAPDVGGSGWFEINSITSVDGITHRRLRHGDFNVAQVPEPGTLGLLGAGLLLLGASRRQRRPSP